MSVHDEQQLDRPASTLRGIPGQDLTGGKKGGGWRGKRNDGKPTFHVPCETRKSVIRESVDSLCRDGVNAQ